MSGSSPTTHLTARRPGGHVGGRHDLLIPFFPRAGERQNEFHGLLAPASLSRLSACPRGRSCPIGIGIAAPRQARPTRRFSHCPSANETISWSGWGVAGGRGGRSPSPPAPGKGREAGLCLGAARRRPALPPASLPRLPASPRGTACPNMFEDEVFSARRHVCVLIVNQGRGTSA